MEKSQEEAIKELHSLVLQLQQIQENMLREAETSFVLAERIYRLSRYGLLASQVRPFMAYSKIWRSLSSMLRSNLKKLGKKTTSLLQYQTTPVVLEKTPPVESLVEQAAQSDFDAVYGDVLGE